MHNGEKQNSMPTPRGSAKCWTCAAHSWHLHLFILFTSHFIYCSLRFDQSIQLGALLSAPRKYFNWMIRIGLLGPLGARWDRISRRWTCGCSAVLKLYEYIHFQADLIARHPYEINRCQRGASLNFDSLKRPPDPLKPPISSPQPNPHQIGHRERQQIHAHKDQWSLLEKANIKYLLIIYIWDLFAERQTHASNIDSDLAPKSTAATANAARDGNIWEIASQYFTQSEVFFKERYILISHILSTFIYIKY